MTCHCEVNRECILAEFIDGCIYPPKQPMQNGSHQNFGRTSNKPDNGYHIQEITIQTLSRLNLQPEGWNGGIQIQQNGAYKMISKPDGGSPT